MARIRVGLLACDMVMSLMWVWASALVKMLVYHVLGLAHTPEGEALKIALSVAYMFFFAWLADVTNGGSYNPLTVLSYAFTGGFGAFVFTLFGRIPAQVFGSIVGVRLIKQTFPAIGHGNSLNVKIHHGALTEGLLTLAIVVVSTMIKKKDPKSFFMKTWISSIAKLTLHILGSDLTGGIMNPASAFGWAYNRGDHITSEHILVYWVAPIQATIIGVLAFQLFDSKGKDEQTKQKAKSE